MKKQRAALPGNFYKIMERGDFEEIKAVFQDPEMVKELIEDKISPFFYYSPCTEIYKWFVEQGFDIHLKKLDGLPIHYHARVAKQNLEGILLAGGDADIEAETGPELYTPLLMAAGALHSSTLSVLIRYGADVNAKTKFVQKMGALDLIFRKWEPRNAVAALECMEMLVHAGITVEEGMKEKVIDLCKEYEVWKASTDTDDLQPYEEAMTRTCQLFGVERPVFKVHDGKSLITVTSTKWNDQHKELWDMLVPWSGVCKTVQGEVIRIGGRISDEIFRNAGGNWDRDHRKMLNALKKYYAMGKVHDEEEYREALALIKSIGKDSDGADITRLLEINVHWVLANPEPILLGKVDYRR